MIPEIGSMTSKSLHGEEVARRLALLEAEYVAPLSVLVRAIRRERNLDDEVPYFDPLDGGIRARALFLLEAPGPKACSSGFVSRDNPDETAKNMLELLRDAGLARHETILWNIVPWYIGSAGRIRAAKRGDLEEGGAYLERLLQLLPGLVVIALVGRKAQRGYSRLRLPDRTAVV